MEAKHTPGPWYVLTQPRYNGLSIRFKTGDSDRPIVPIAIVNGRYSGNHPYGSSDANARLIAAAPELLYALQAVLDDVQDIDNDSCLSVGVGRQVRAAIAKATGGEA